MSTYLIGTIDVDDAETYDLYRSFNPALVEAAGGEYVIKGKPTTVLEGEDFRSRFVMIRFANEAALRKFYGSDEYQQLRGLRLKSARSSIAMINDDDNDDACTAYQIDRFGAETALAPAKSSLPELDANDVRIQPTMIAINPVDWKICDGMLAALPFALPYTPGCEGVGIIEKVGGNVKGLMAGQRVMAFSSLLRGGWFASKVDVAADQCALVPVEVDDEEAAARAISLLTAQQVIDLHEGTISRALVIGASGSVGSIATALLRNRGVPVDAICSPTNSDFVAGLGADVVTSEHAAAQKYDLVLDAAGGPGIEAGYRGLADQGTLVSIVQPVDEARATAVSGKAIRYSAQPDGEQLSALIAHHDKLPAPRVSAVLPIAQINTALDLAKHGRVRGKILLKAQAC